MPAAACLLSWARALRRGALTARARAQVGAPGSVGAPEQSFECPACRQPLAAAQVFSGAALRGCPAAAAPAPSGCKAEGAGGTDAPGWPAPAAGPGARGAGAQCFAGGGASWQSSAKISFLLGLLGELAARNAAAGAVAAQQCDPGRRGAWCWASILWLLQQEASSVRGEMSYCQG